MKATLIVLVVAALTGCSSEPASTDGPQATGAGQTISISSKSSEALAHFQKGESLLDNLRTQEAAKEFSQALKLDPDFVLARAYLGAATPGPDGLVELEGARQAAGALPEAERLLIEGQAANRRGDSAEARTAFTRVSELAPNDWRAHYALGQQSFNDERFGDAARALKRAVELNPNAGGAQNMLGYAALRQLDLDGAIAAFTEYSRLLPQEPNPHDSLGEALLAAGRFKEAEAAFLKALELSPDFWNAHQGIAYTRFYAGDWTGSRDAFAKAKAGATPRLNRIAVDVEAAVAAAAQGNAADALRALDAAEKTDGAQIAELAFIPVNRALVLINAGRGREALTPIAAALQTAEGGQLPAGLSRNVRRAALRARVTAEAQMRDVAAAEKTSAALDADASSRAGDPAAQTAMHYGRGQLAIARADVAAARGHFDRCSMEDYTCKWQGVIGAEKAGDKAASAAAREQLLRIYRRDPEHLLVRARLMPTKTTRP